MKRIILTLTMAALMGTFATAQRVEPYLTTEQMPDGIKYLPAPPDTTSQFFVADYLRYEWGKGLRDSERGRQAVSDADCGQAGMARYYSAALGVQISETTTPALYRLIGRVARTASDATGTAKNHYMRPRPFMHFHQHTSTMSHEKDLRKNGSYPSGHTSIGWGVALVLVEICPEKQDEILRMGYEFGQSRVIVGAHYQSDVDAGRMVAAAAVARMHADETFRQEMAAAKAELDVALGHKPVLKGKPRRR